MSGPSCGAAGVARIVAHSTWDEATVRRRLAVLESRTDAEAVREREFLLSLLTPETRGPCREE